VATPSHGQPVRQLLTRMSVCHNVLQQHLLQCVFPFPVRAQVVSLWPLVVQQWLAMDHYTLPPGLSPQQQQGHFYQQWHLRLSIRQQRRA
jgi:hypothetical protein